MLTFYRFAACLLLLLVQGLNSEAQTTFFTDNFNNGCTSLCPAISYGGWSVTNTGVNGASANTWYVSCAENGNAVGTCGAGCGADASLHVGNVAGSPGGLCPSGDCGAAYDASNASIITNRRVESPLINCSGFSNIVLAYDFIAQGAPGTDFYSVEYSSNGGGTWTSLGAGPTSLCCCSALDCFFGCCPPSTTTCGSLRQGRWTAASINLPASANNNPNVRIGFNWTNNGDNLGTDPSVVIDDLTLSGQTVLHANAIVLEGSVGPEGNRLDLTSQNGQKLAWVQILRSFDGVLFAPIGEKKMEASAKEASDRFSWLDTDPASDQLFYQVRARMEDGLLHTTAPLELNRTPGQSLEIRLYPNPSTAGQQVTLEVRNPQNQSLEVLLSDMQGRILSRQKAKVEAGTHQRHLDLSGLNAGPYFLQVKGNGTSAWTRVLVAK